MNLQELIFAAILFIAKGVLVVPKARFEIPEVAPQEEQEVIGAYDIWSKNCPHVSDNPPYRKLVVTWTLNGAIWLKIDNGKAMITNRLTSIKHINGTGRHTLRVILNNRRYSFFHDESTGVFSLSIDPIRSADSGVWQCHVEIYSMNGGVEQRSSTKSLQVTGDDPNGGAYSTGAPEKNSRRKEFIIQRELGEHNHKTIEIEDNSSEISTLNDGFGRRSQSANRNSISFLLLIVISLKTLVVALRTRYLL